MQYWLMFMYNFFKKLPKKCQDKKERQTGENKKRNVIQSALKDKLPHYESMQC